MEQYRHNGGEDNADAHMKCRIMGREVVAVSDGRRDFGTWERIFYGEFDGRRPKRVLVSNRALSSSVARRSAGTAESRSSPSRTSNNWWSVTAWPSIISPSRLFSPPLVVVVHKGAVSLAPFHQVQIDRPTRRRFLSG